jgi:hypothetical protein
MIVGCAGDTDSCYLGLQVIREKDSAVFMASQIEDEEFKVQRPPTQIKMASWNTEEGNSGKKLDLLPSQDEIAEVFASSSQPSQSRRRMQRSSSTTHVSQSQPSASRRNRSPYFNTQKPTAVIDLEALDEISTPPNWNASGQSDYDPIVS